MTQTLKMFRQNILFKTVIFSVLSIIFFFTFQTLKVHAADSDMDRQNRAAAGEDGANFGAPRDPKEIVAGVIRTFLSMLGILFLAYTVYAGYLVMFSAGDEEKVNKGKSTLRTAMIGLLVIFSGYSILIFVMKVVLTSQIDRSGDTYVEFGVTQDEYNYCINGGGDAVSCQRGRR